MGISCSATFVNTGAFGSSFTGSPSKGFSKSYGSSDISKVYMATLTVTSTPTSIDLTNQTDPFGNAVSFSTVKHIEIINEDTTNALTVGGGANGLFAALPFNLTGQAAPSGGGSTGGAIAITANITVDGTHKILTLAATAGSITVDVFILGS